MAWDGECVDKVQNCDVPVEDQPEDLQEEEDGSYSCTCDTGFSWDETMRNCLSCATHKCSACTFLDGYPECTACTPGHTLDINNICIPDDVNCLDTVKSADECENCKSNYFFDVEFGRCVSCLETYPNA